MATLPTILVIPMKYERKMKRSVERGDMNELYNLAFKYSLNSEDGPGYLGYLFYTLYYTQLIQAYFKYIVTNLSMTSREQLKRNLVGKLHIIRRGYLGMFSDYEKAFMEEYGYDMEKIREKILTRKIDTKIDNYYYSTYFKHIKLFLERNKMAVHSEYSDLYKVFNSMIRLGIEIFLIYSWTLYLYTFIFHFLRNNEDINNVYEKAVNEGLPIKIIENLIRIAKIYGYTLKWLSDTIKFASQVFSLNVIIKHGGEYDEIITYGSWPPKILLYTFLVMKGKLNPEEVRRAQTPMCRLFRLFWIGVYAYTGFNTDVKEHTYSLKEDKCIIKIEVLREATGEAT